LLFGSKIEIKRLACARNLEINMISIINRSDSNHNPALPWLLLVAVLFGSVRALSMLAVQKCLLRASLVKKSGFDKGLFPIIKLAANAFYESMSHIKNMEFIINAKKDFSRRNAFGRNARCCAREWSRIGI
jgi:hypothetical protein